jgi:thiamine-phosphate pyrophosphorylase
MLAADLRDLSPELTLIVNGHPDVARALGAILHVGRRGLSVAGARRLIGEEVLLSYAAHSPMDARRAAEDGADVLLISPLFRTFSHPGDEPGEVHLLQRTCDALSGVSPGPGVYALGGIAPGHVAACLQAGAHGVAVLSGLLEAPDPEEAARAYLGAFR